MNIFLSYSSRNYDEACEICDFLEYNGHQCFIAPRDIRTGFSYAEEIMRGLDSAEFLVLLMSPDANASQHVLREVERAVNVNIPMVTYYVAPTELNKSFEYFLMPYQWLNMWEDPDHLLLLDGINVLYEHEGYSDEVANKPKKNLIPVFAVIGVLAVAVIILVVVLISQNIKNGTYVADNKGDVSNANVNVSGDNNVTNADNSVNDNANGTQTEIVTVTVDDIYLGQTVVFGRYINQPIAWYVVEVTDDGIAELISRDIITFKAFDAAESGKYGVTSSGVVTDVYTSFSLKEYVEAQGSSRWKTSNIRTWLNSSESKVLYEDQAPVDKAFECGVDGYAEEAGFLLNFSEAERKAMVLSHNLTGYYDIATDDFSQKDATDDYVYLPVADDLLRLDKAKVPVTAVPTDKAVNQAKSTYYSTHSLDFNTYSADYWLRDNCGSPTTVMLVYSYGFDTNMRMGTNAATDGIGVRPMIKVNISSGMLKKVIEES